MRDIDDDEPRCDHGVCYRREMCVECENELLDLDDTDFSFLAGNVGDIREDDYIFDYDDQLPNPLH